MPILEAAGSSLSIAQQLVQISGAAACGVAAWVNEHTPKLTGPTRRYGDAQCGSITTKVPDPNRAEADRLLNPPDLPSYRTVLLDADGVVATITLNRPHRRNAVGDGMREELADAYLNSLVLALEDKVEATSDGGLEVEYSVRLPPCPTI